VFSEIHSLQVHGAKEMCPAEMERPRPWRRGETDQSRNSNRVVVLVLCMSNLSLLRCERRYL
jgi:hypothetical protein